MTKLEKRPSPSHSSGYPVGAKVWAVQGRQLCSECPRAICDTNVFPGLPASCQLQAFAQQSGLK